LSGAREDGGREVSLLVSFAVFACSTTARKNSPAPS
jgi:hypothetical protein